MLSNMGVPLAENRRCRFGPKRKRVESVAEVMMIWLA